MGQCSSSSDSKYLVMFTKYNWVELTSFVTSIAESSSSYVGGVWSQWVERILISSEYCICPPLALASILNSNNFTTNSILGISIKIFRSVTSVVIIT